MKTLNTILLTLGLTLGAAKTADAFDDFYVGSYDTTTYENNGKTSKMIAIDGCKLTEEGLVSVDGRLYVLKMNDPDTLHTHSGVRLRAGNMSVGETTAELAIRAYGITDSTYPTPDNEILFTEINKPEVYQGDTVSMSSPSVLGDVFLTVNGEGRNIRIDSAYTFGDATYTPNLTWGCGGDIYIARFIRDGPTPTIANMELGGEYELSQDDKNVTIKYLAHDNENNRALIKFVNDEEKGLGKRSITNTLTPLSIDDIPGINEDVPDTLSLLKGPVLAVNSIDNGNAEIELVRYEDEKPMPQNTAYMELEKEYTLGNHQLQLSKVSKDSAEIICDGSSFKIKADEITQIAEDISINMNNGFYGRDKDNNEIGLMLGTYHVTTQINPRAYHSNKNHQNNRKSSTYDLRGRLVDPSKLTNSLEDKANGVLLIKPNKGQVVKYLNQK